eukprot:m.1301188 g.1301188  ORF g.1301188 m.1301188 type:complete len:769 (+) comp24805_c0_seq4:231-2537(+)
MVVLDEALLRKRTRGAALRKINFGAYGINDIAPGTLESVSGLKALDLSNNNLRHLSLRSDSLISIDVTNNELQNVADFFSLKGLKEISCEGNRDLPKCYRLLLIANLPLLQSINGKEIKTMRQRVLDISSALTKETATVTQRGKHRADGQNLSSLFGKVRERVKSSAGGGHLSDEEDDFLRFCFKEQITLKAPTTPPKKRTAQLQGSTGHSIPAATTSPRRANGVASTIVRAGRAVSKTTHPDNTPTARDGADTHKHRRSDRTSTKVVTNTWRMSTEPGETPADNSNDVTRPSEISQQGGPVRKRTTQGADGNAARQPRRAVPTDAFTGSSSHTLTATTGESVLPVKKTQRETKKRKAESEDLAGKRRNGSSSHHNEEASDRPSKHIVTAKDALQQDIIDVTGFDLRHLVRSHGEQSMGVDDCLTPVWGCARAPGCSGSSGTITAHVVATCGGDSVCFVDCTIGKVVRKYTHTGEEFFAVAWTAVAHDAAQDLDESVLLAAGGLQGIIKLIDYGQLVCYEQLAGHEAYICDIKFHPTHQDRMVSADASGLVLVWKVVPYGSSGSTTQVSQLVCGDLYSCFTLHPKDNMLVTGNMSGRLSCWTIENKSESTKQKSLAGSPHKHVIDSIVHLDDDCFASRATNESSIYIWELDVSAASVRLLRMLECGKAPFQWLKISAVTARDKTVHLFAGGSTGEIYVYRVPRSGKSKGKEKKGTVPRSKPWMVLGSYGPESDSLGTTREVVAFDNLGFLVAVSHGRSCLWPLRACFW